MLCACNVSSNYIFFMGECTLNKMVTDVLKGVFCFHAIGAILGALHRVQPSIWLHVLQSVDHISGDNAPEKRN